MTMKLYVWLDGLIGGEPHAFGSRETPLKTYSSTQVLDKTFVLATTTKTKIFDVTLAGHLTDFDFMLIESDVDVELQVTVGAGDANESYQVVKLAAGVPFLLGADDGLLGDGSVDLFDGTDDLIEEIWVHNTDAGNATVKLVVLT